MRARCGRRRSTKCKKRLCCRRHCRLRHGRTRIRTPWQSHAEADGKRERERERERKRERKRKREREREAGREGERSHSLPNQDNAFSLRVVEEKFNAVLVVCSIEGVAANSDAR